MTTEILERNLLAFCIFQQIRSTVIDLKKSLGIALKCLAQLDDPWPHPLLGVYSQEKQIHMGRLLRCMNIDVMTHSKKPLQVLENGLAQLDHPLQSSLL